MKNASNTGFSIGGNVLAALWTLLNLENSCCMSAEVKTSIFPKNVDALLGRRTRDPRLTYIVTQKVRHANHYTTVILTKEQWKCCQVMKIYECSQHLLLRSSWQHLLCKTWFLAQNESGQKCRDPGSNRGPLDLQSNALPTELSWRMWDGPQNLHSITLLPEQDGCKKRDVQVLPRFELGSQDSESWVLTITP